MSLLNRYNFNNKRKKVIYPKQLFQKQKSSDNSSKSTRAASKNFFIMKNKKLIEKIEYHDLYSDLVPVRQKNQLCINKKYPKEENEDSDYSTSLDAENFNLKKKIKSYSQKKAKVDVLKYYKEDGNVFEFPLFKESQVKLNEYDNKVKIESAEDDFESDDNTLDYGAKKVENDLIEAFAIIKKENFHCLENYKTYEKLFKKQRKKLDLKKNLPCIEIKTKEKAKNDK